MPIRIACLQTTGTPSDVGANLDELAQAAGEAHSNGADLLITPEMFLTGYNVGADLPRLAASNLVGPVRVMAERLGIAILFGVPEQVDDGIYNSAVLVDDTGGVVAQYRKSHLFSDVDRSQFLAGDEPFEMVELRDVKIAILICYDVEFPEVVRAAALQGAHLIAVPTAQMEPFAFIAEQVVRTRAWENQVYVAYVNHDGAEGDLSYVGRSSIVAPDATVLDAVERGNRLIYATVDPDVVHAQQISNPYLDDRRPALYHHLTVQGSSDDI